MPFGWLPRLFQDLPAPGEVRDVKSKTVEKLTDNCWSSSLEAILNHLKRCGGMGLREIQAAVEINLVFIIIRFVIIYLIQQFYKASEGAILPRHYCFVADSDRRRSSSLKVHMLGTHHLA